MNKYLKIISVVAVLSLAGCGIRDKITDVATEKIIEKTSGANKVNINRKKGKVSVEGEDGQSLSFGDTEWPDNELANSIPEFKKAKILTVIEAPGTVMIAFEDVDEDDFSEYYSVVEKEYTEQAYKTNSEGYFSYSASNVKEQTIQLSYTEGKMIINIYSDGE